jgi:50S ribosomal protein L16 3-hydroxylase
LTDFPGDLSVETFLDCHWQREPCRFRLHDDALAGIPSMEVAMRLAGEDEVDSRLVSGTTARRDWHIEYGPFSAGELERLPGEAWSLLIQDVEKLHPPLCPLLDAFGFIPSWRLDDAMVSWSAVGGSVGPHVDEYDVFLVQFGGRKRWHLARSFDPARLDDCELDVLADFNPEWEWTLAPGEVLYLPPGIAHHGIALEPGGTCSVGLRAPNAADLLQAWGEWLAEYRSGGRRYGDPSPLVPSAAGEVTKADLDRLRALMLKSVSDESEFPEFALEFLSRFRTSEGPSRPTPTAPQIDSWLRGDRLLAMDPWARACWSSQPGGGGGSAILYVSGDRFACSTALATRICGRGSGGFRAGPAASGDMSDRDCLRQLLELGHLVALDES